jgi:hypothetical protein
MFSYTGFEHQTSDPGRQQKIDRPTIIKIIDHDWSVDFCTTFYIWLDPDRIFFSLRQIKVTITVITTATEPLVPLTVTAITTM